MSQVCNVCGYTSTPARNCARCGGQNTMRDDRQQEIDSIRVRVAELEATVEDVVSALEKHGFDPQGGAPLSKAIHGMARELEGERDRVAELEDALAVAQAEVAVERGRVADLTTMNVGLAAIVKDLKARLAALEDDLRQALAEREDDEP